MLLPTGSYSRYKRKSSLRTIVQGEHLTTLSSLESTKGVPLGNDMYAFIAHCQTTLKASDRTRARKIVSIRQFWKYLKTKAHLIDNNIAEELETPRLPKRIPKYLSLEESVRLLIECKKLSCDHYLITISDLACFIYVRNIHSKHLERVKLFRQKPLHIKTRNSRLPLIPLCQIAL